MGIRILCGAVICVAAYVALDVAVAAIRLSMADPDEDELDFIRYENGGLQDRWCEALDPR